MAKKRVKKKQTQLNDEPKEPWYKKLWVVVSVFTFAAFTFLINAPSLLTNLENLPGQVTRITAKFSGWYYEDDDWTGFWSAFPQGYVDAEDMELSDVDLKLEIGSESGQINGMMVNKEICVAAPLSAFLLLDGSVSGKVADITAYDIVGGRRRDLIKMRLERDGIIMTVMPIEGYLDWIPKTSRIARHWENPDQIDEHDWGNSCREEREAFFQALRKNKPGYTDNKRRPVSEY